MCKCKPMAVVVLLLVMALPMVVLSQTVVETLPRQYEFGEVSEWISAGDKQSDARWRERVFERFAPELAAGRYLKILEALADESRADLGQYGGAAGAVFQAQFDMLVGQFRTALQEAAIADAVQTDQQRSAVLDAMGTRGADSLRPEEYSPDGMTFQTVYFMETAHELAPYEETGDGKFSLLIPPEVMYSMRLRGDAVHAIFMDFVAPVQQKQYAAIITANNKWDNYLANGYSQYPWEALLNGWVMNFHAFNPPDKQVILAHPSLAVEASTLSFDEMTAKEVLNVELLGFLWYFGQNNEHYTGLSLSAVLRDDLRPGFGPVLHWRRNISLGLAWHDVDGNDKFDEDPYVFMSVDAFRFMQSEGPKFRAEYEKARAYLD